MSKLKNMPGAAWLVIGVCVTALVLPSAAYAAGALKFTGIEGTNGTTASLNRVGVSSAGQVLTSEADATSLEFDAQSVSQGFECEPVTRPLGPGQSLVLKDVYNSIVDAPPPSQYLTYVTFSINPASNTNCTFNPSGFVNNVVPTGGNIGEVDYPFPSGLVIPNGYQLYAEGWNNIEDQITTNGYFIPSADAPTVPQVASQHGNGAPEQLNK